MADLKTGFDFGLGAITESLGNQVTLAQKRQELELQNEQRKAELARNKVKLSEKALEINQNLTEAMKPLLSTLKTTTAAQEEQDSLRQSGTLSGFLEAEGNKILDPANYTRAGRARQIQEQTNIYQIKTAAADQQQQVLGAAEKVLDTKYNAGLADLSIAQASERIGMERIDASVKLVETQAQVLQNQNSMQQSVLTNLDASQVRAAKQKANGQPIDIGGVQISPGLLDARLEQIEALDEAKLMHEAAKQTNNEKLADMATKKWAERAPIEELQKAMQSPGEDQKLEILTDAYTRRRAIESEAIQRKLTATKYTDFDNAVVVPAAQEVTRWETAARPGSIAATGVTTYKKALSQAGNMMADWEAANPGVPMPETQKAVVDAVIQQGRAAADAAITQQVKIEGKGDENLQNILTSVYRGEPAPQAAVQNAVTERLEKNRSLSDVFPPATAALIEKKYREKLTKKGPVDYLNPATAEDLKIRKQQAQDEAVQEGIRESMANREDDRMVGQLKQQGNPLASLYTPTSLIGEIKAADDEGEATFMRINNITPEQMAQLRAGKDIPSESRSDGGFSAARARTELYQMQNQALFVRLDTKQPGISTKYVDWWTKNADSYGRDTAQKRAQATPQGGVQQAAFDTYANDIEYQGTQDYAASIYEAHQSYDVRKDQMRKDMFSFGLDPVQKQATMLQFDKSLTDSERKAFMKGFVNPIIADAKKKGLDFHETNSLIEKAIESNVTSDPEIAKLLKKVGKERESINQNLETVVNQGQIGNRAAFLGGPNAPANQLKNYNTFPWLQDLMNEGK